jgi:biotin carboxyl carrier protein
MEFKVKRTKADDNESVVAFHDLALKNEHYLGQVVFANVTHAGKSQEVQITGVGDGLSYLVGHEVVRILPKVRKGKSGAIMVWHRGVGCSAFIAPVRPVEPKVTAAQLGGGPIKSPMSGKVIKVLVKKGDAVSEGQLLCVIEAMKMENQIKSECMGVIEDVKAVEGSSVTSGEILVTVEPKRDVI